MTEHWLPIAGYAGLYEISDGISFSTAGRIASGKAWKDSA